MRGMFRILRLLGDKRRIKLIPTIHILGIYVL